MSTIGDDEDITVNESHLKFPKLLIEASLESLLSHSQSSGTRTLLPMPRSEISLSESWSSLSEHELSHDEDLRSEATDTGSLIDVSTAGDIHTVNEQGESSDVEEDHNDNTWDEQEDRLVENKLNRDRQQACHTMEKSYESIGLDKSTVVVDANGEALLQRSETSVDAEMRSSSVLFTSGTSSGEFTTNIEMSMSQDTLKLGRRPYQILYYGSKFCSPGVKSEVLGKIGAALISSHDQSTYEDNGESPCFHVIPSEFGPGSRPSTADLIPIPTQLHVSDCKVVESSSKSQSSSTIEIRLSTDKTLISRRAHWYELNSRQQWPQPDLVVIIISQNDTPKDSLEAEKIFELATRHRIPVICLRQEGGWTQANFMTDAAPSMLHMSVLGASQQCDTLSNDRMLVDVDSFLALDSEQLNQHLNYLADSSSCPSELQSSIASQFCSHTREMFDKISMPVSRRLDRKARSQKFDKLPSSYWILESRQTGSSSSVEYEKPSLAVPWKSKDRAFLLTALYRTTMLVGFTGFVVLCLLTFQAFLSSLISAKMSNHRDLLSARPVGQEIGYSVPAPSMLTTTPSVTTTTQVYALSRPLHALEQQVQKWVPKNSIVPKKNSVTTTTKPAQASETTRDPQICHDIVPALIMPSLKIDPVFFSSDEAAFTVRVYRGSDRVAAKVDKVAKGVASINVKRKDLWGQLTVHMDRVDEHTCANINLENSISESVTNWLKSLQSENLKLRGVKRIANEYSRLLEVRTTKPGFVNSALELQYSAVRGIGAAVEAVEKTAVKQIKDCQEQNEECITHRLGEMLKPAQQARRLSQDLIQSTREQISVSAKQARNRANEATVHAKEEISKALQVMQVSIGELSLFASSWPDKVTETLAEAQQRANKLVSKARRD